MKRIGRRRGRRCGRKERLRGRTRKIMNERETKYGEGGMIKEKEKKKRREQKMGR